MHSQKLTRHFHTYGISIKTFDNTPGLHDEFLITQIDSFNDTSFVDAMEHKKYPIFTIMYHPEYQLSHLFLESGQSTDEIAFLVSLKLNRLARKNNNRVKKQYEDLF